MSYCEFAPGQDYHGPYHEHEYGFPIRDDAALFERFALEINQAGLSWLTVLKKRPAFQRAFRGFDIDRVARFNASDRERLLNDESIIRNRLKIDAVIDNAKLLRQLRAQYGSFAEWLDAHHPRTLHEWTRLFKQTFRFTGGEIVRELLVSTGYLPGAHVPDCPVYARVLALTPPWSKIQPEPDRSDSAESITGDQRAL